MEKKADMGIGTLIVFIAVLLVAAIAGGILIITGQSLEEKAYSSGSGVRDQVTTNIHVIQIFATDGRAGLTNISEVLKMSPGSDGINLQDTVIHMSTQNATSAMSYRGVGSACQISNQNGFNTWTEEELGRVQIGQTVYLEEDLDDDRQDDTLDITANHVVFELSSAGTFLVPLGADITVIPPEGVPINVVNGSVGDSAATYADVTVQGTVTEEGVIGEEMTFLVTPYRKNSGYYTAVYQNEGTNFLEGRLQQGDVVELCFEAPAALSEDELVRIGIIPAAGQATYSQFYVPQAVSTEHRVYLYP